MDKATAVLQQAADRQVAGYKIHRLLAKISQARGEFDKALSHSVRALELNPNDGDLLAAYGQMLTFAGQSKEARRWVDDAMRRNPHYPGWYASALSAIQYLQKDYDGAIASLNKADQLAVWDRRFLAASYAQLGRQDEAKVQVEAVLESDPKFSISKFKSKLRYRRDDDKAHFLEGLKKAGFPE